VVDLTALADLAEILSALAVVGGIWFALIQLREYRTQRRDAAIFELMRAFAEPEFARAVRLVRGLPDDVSAAELRASGSDREEAAIMISITYETKGLLVFRQMTSFPLVQELTGGLAVVMWRKLRVWAAEIRSEQKQPSFAEWFQWLAERLAQHGKDRTSPPAYERLSGWIPTD
jgi:hypothetical protein